MRRSLRRAGKHGNKRQLRKGYAERLEPRWVLNTAPVLDPINVSPDGQEGALITFTATATDAETPDQLTFLLDPDETPEGASIDRQTGVFTWIPNEQQGGQTFRIVVLVTDAGSATGNPLADAYELHFNIAEVDDPPVLDPIGDRTIDELQTLTFTVSATDPDTPLEELTFSATGLPDGAEFDPVTRTFTWTPTEEQGPGVYQVTFTVTDNTNPGLSDSETITITVNEVNRSPDLAPIDDMTVALGDTLTFTATATDPDLPANALTFSLDNSAPEGATIDPVTGVFSWTPASHQVGTFTIIVLVTDNGSPPLADSETFTVTVTSPNQPPVLTPIGNQEGDEGTLITFTAQATDPEGDNLTFSLEGAPDGAVIDPVTGVFTWTPAEDQDGVFTFDVVVTDDGDPVTSARETITITVHEVNAPPVLVLVEDQTVNEGELLTVVVEATDSDIPLQTLVFSLTAAPPGAAIDPATGVITWTPGAADQGTHVFTVSVSDGVDSVSQNFNVTVIDQNTPPELDPIDDITADEHTTIMFTATATDADGDNLVFSLEGDVPAGATITPEGVFTWATDEADGPGVYTFDVVVTDDGFPVGVDRRTITITVNEVNQAPTIEDIPDTTADEGLLFTLQVMASDADLPAQTLTYSLTAAPEGATIDPVTGLISWTPGELDGGTTVLFTVEVSDGLATASTSFQVTVNETNAPPIITPIDDQTIDELSLFTLAVVAEGGDDTPQSLTYSLDAASLALGMTIDAFGVISWTPSEEQGPGVYEVTVTVTDDGTPAESSTATFTITVNEVNQDPTLTIPDQAGAEGTLLTFVIAGDDADLPVQTLTYSLEPGSPAGATIDPDTGEFSWLLPAVTELTQFTITVRVTDSFGGSATASFTVDVAVASPVVLVKNINASGSSNPRDLTPIGGTMYFIAGDGVNGFELWKTDGTDAGTVLVKDIAPDAFSSDGSNLVNVGGTLFFTANDGTNGFELWRSDGTADGTVLVKDINPGGSSNPSSLVNVGGTLFFVANDGTNGFELWRSDGTEDGTVLVKNINAGGDSAAARLVNVGGTLFFVANDGTNGLELWTSDGTEDGTVLVKNINASGGSSPSGLVNLGGTLYFSANDGAGDGLWTSDGTEAGTELISPHFMGEARYLTNVGGTLFFSAADAAHGRELWKSDGTLAGTQLVEDVFVGGANSSHPRGLTNVGGTLFFYADDATGQALWKADDTGAELVKRLPDISNLTNVNGLLLFTSDEGSGAALWMSDGTADGTVRVDGIADGFWTDMPGAFRVMNGTLFFAANDGANGRELWRLTNAPPAFAATTLALSAAEHAELTAQFTATDFDAGQSLTYTLDAGGAVGMTLDPATGAFAWTPGEEDGGQTFVIVITATDNHPVFPLSAKLVVTITVDEVNSPPVLEVGDHVLAAGVLASFVVTATDDDLPAQTLTLSATDLPDGATFDPLTGEFAWTPDVLQAGTHTVTFHVSDGVTTVSKSVNLEVVASLLQEAEEAKIGSDGVAQDRAAASGGKTLLLAADGHRSEYTIEILAAANYTLVVHYSNQGGEDTIDVLVDGALKGSFVTVDTGDWNAFSASTAISLGVLTPGQLTLALELATTDGGVEIDYFTLVPGDPADPGLVADDVAEGVAVDFNVARPPLDQGAAPLLAPPGKASLPVDGNGQGAANRPSILADRLPKRLARAAKLNDLALADLWGEL